MEKDGVEEDACAQHLVAHDDLAHAECDLVVRTQVDVASQSLLAAERRERVELLLVLRRVATLHVSTCRRTALKADELSKYPDFTCTV